MLHVASSSGKSVFNMQTTNFAAEGEVSSWSLVVPFVFDAAPLHTLIELEEEDLFVCRPVGPPTPAVPGLHCVAWFLFCGGYLVLPSFPRVHVLL